MELTKEQIRRYEHEEKLDRLKKSNSPLIQEYRDYDSVYTILEAYTGKLRTSISHDEIKDIADRLEAGIKHQEMLDASLEEMA